MDSIKRAFLFITVVFFTPFAQAIPMLSDDGSMLTRLDVDGVLYDVSFQDGVLNEVFDPGVVASTEWGEFVPKLVSALNSAFAELNLGGSGLLLQGCTSLALCIAYIPDLVGTDDFTATSLASYHPEFSPADPIPGVPLASDFDTGVSPGMTLVTFQRSATAVPVPSSLYIVLVGLMAVFGAMKLRGWDPKHLQERATAVKF